MKWYKHDSNANQDAKLRKVRLKYGMEGYGLYWYCLELIAQNVEKHNLRFELEHDSEIISADTNIHYELVQEMMTYMVTLGLFEQAGNIITCLKMATRTDEYTQKIIRKGDSVPTISGHTPDKVPPNRTEENRTEEKKTSGRFKEPSLAEVSEYCAERGNGVDPSQWMNHYEAKGFMIGKNKMRSWKAAVRTWEKTVKSDDDMAGAI